MKAVTDAVNRFKCVFPYKAGHYIIHWANPNCESLFTYSGLIDTCQPNSNWYSVCTREQFNTEVEHLSSNMGRATQTYSDYKKEFEYMTTTTIDHTSEEFWKDAPELATHYDLVASLFSNKDGFWRDGRFNECGHNRWGTERYTPRPKPSPVFTQAMADNGELPPVGCECMVLGKDADYDYHKCEVLLHRFHLKGIPVALFVIRDYKGNNYYYSHCSYQHFKPLDTRTDEEKAIDEACLVIDDSKRCIKANTNIDCSVAMKAVIITLIKNGYVKPLTVEGE